MLFVLDKPCARLIKSVEDHRPVIVLGGFSTHVYSALNYKILLIGGLDKVK